MNHKTVFIALQQFCEQDDQPLKVLQRAGFEVHRNSLGRRIHREEMLEAFQGADAVLAGVEPYDANLLEALPRLKCISRCGAGTDSIDLEAARRRNITVLTTPEEATEPVAQLTLGMILALARNLLLHGKDFDAGQWRKRTGHLLSEWTLGLVGFGRIGRALERHLRTFGPKILVADPFIQPQELPEGVVLCDLPRLLSQADLISIHVNRRPEEGVLIGQNELALMKRGSYLVNTARGHLVDEEALFEALKSGHLSGAALDVFEEEPYTGPLSRLPQVICTPHVATLTQASRAAMELRCARNVMEFFQNRS